MDSYIAHKQLSDLLGIGIATLNRYENGALQTEANNRLITLFIEDPKVLLHVLNVNPNILQEPDRGRLFKLLQGKKGNSSLVNDAIERFGSYPASIMKGVSRVNYRCMLCSCSPRSGSGQF